MLKVPSAISKITTMSDGGLRLYIDTAELAPQDKSELMGMYNKSGWFVFSDTGIMEADVPTEQVEFKNDRTPGQRLRGVIFRLWEQSSSTTRGDFETFYKIRIEKLIDQIKEKLN
jgi:hypothetical protein